MTDASEGPGLHPAVISRRLWVVRGAALASMVVILLPYWFLSLPFQVPFLITLWRLRGRPRKDGLALAIGTGGVLFVGAVLISLYLLADYEEGAWVFLGLLAFLSALQVILVWGAFAIYRVLGREKGDWRILIRGVVDPAVYFGVIAGLVLMGSNAWLEKRVRGDPAAAIAWLKRMHGCASAYASSRPAVGFPRRLELLGPSGTNCIEPLSGGDQKAGYAFTYIPFPADAAGRISTYTVTARPVRHGQVGQRSFFMWTTRG